MCLCWRANHVEAVAPELADVAVGYGAAGTALDGGCLRSGCICPCIFQLFGNFVFDLIILYMNINQ